MKEKVSKGEGGALLLFIVKRWGEERKSMGHEPGFAGLSV